MEKEKKVAKKSTSTAKKTVSAPAKAKKIVPAKKPVAVKAEKVEKVKAVEPKVEVKPVQPVEKVEKKPITLNQDLNLMIGLFSILTIISFCFAFQGGEVEILGWELFLSSGNYLGGVFKGVMIIYVISLFIDCILAVCVDTDNEIVNIVEKALYMFTLVTNVIVNAILLSLIKKIGIGLIIFLIVSIISAIVKLTRIYAKK